ncbi:antirestriction protein ArdA, partial [Escherichia coli]
VGTWHKYNCGSIAGRWFDLATFDDERDFFAACRSLHQDEADPELMFQDYEGFPGNMASECHINWAYVEGFRQARDEGCEEAYRLWVDDTGETDFDTFRDAWWGEADSEEAFAVEFASDTGLLASGGGMACQAAGKPWQAYACLKCRRAAPAALPFLPVMV